MGRRAWAPRAIAALVSGLCLCACSTTGEPQDRSGPAPLDEPFRVLLLGDSISIGYTAEVRRILEGRALVVRPTSANGGAENCAGTNNALTLEEGGATKLERWLALEGGAWDVIHFNFGLHDLKRVNPESGRNSNDPKDPHQAEPERYGAQLAQVVELLEATGARLVLATTTPVPEGDLRPYREPADSVLYNELAVGVAAEAGLQVNDLYGFSQPRLALIQRPENVHFHPEGSGLLAAQVANAILAAAGKPPIYPGPTD